MLRALLCREIKAGSRKLVVRQKLKEEKSYQNMKDTLLFSFAEFLQFSK